MTPRLSLGEILTGALLAFVVCALAGAIGP